MGVTSTFQWFADRIERAVLGDIDAKLEQTGAQWLTLSRSMAPERTGFLKQQESYRVANHTLTLVMGAPYDLLVERGTRFMMPHPHAFPALNAVSRVWGGTFEIEASLPHIASPILSHQGGFIVPSGIQPRPLTRAQHEHVKRHLLPTSKKLWGGNVKRAKLRVRRHGA